MNFLDLWTISFTLLSKSTTNIYQVPEHLKEREDVMKLHVIVHRDAYFTSGPHKKLLPLYVKPFLIMGKVDDNAYEIKILDNLRHSVINVQWLKKVEIRREQFK